MRRYLPQFGSVGHQLIMTILLLVIPALLFLVLINYWFAQQSLNLSHELIEHSSHAIFIGSQQLDNLAQHLKPIETMLKNQAITNLIFLLFAISLITFVAFSISNSISIPLGKLVESVNLIAEGDFSHQVSIAAKHEFKILEKSINQMIYNLASYIETIEEVDEEIQQRNKDLTNLIQVAQTISGEIQLDKLLVKLIKVVLETAEAGRCVLILERQGMWVIEAEGSSDEIEVTVLQSVPVGVLYTSPLVPVSLVNQVVRSQENIIFHNPMQYSSLIADTYLATVQPQSIFCTPLFNRGQVIGLFYVENGSFSSDRLQILDLLAGQGAISIANARLYSHQLELINAYERFVPSEFLHLLHKESIVQVKLGDQTEAKMSVLFADIRSFTTLSEQMEPQENFKFINAYFGRMSPIIREYNGFIDKYMGDGIMAVFPTRADDAVRAAIAMQQGVSEYNLYREMKGRQPIVIGIGLHTDNVVLGTVGEAARMEGTVISDGVNLTSRLENLTKLYGVSILVSQQTLFNLENPTQYRFRFLDKVRVSGKQDAIAVFEMLDGEPDEIIALKMNTRTDFEKGLLHYYSQEFDEAMIYFNEVLATYPEDRAAVLYSQRAQYFLNHGVPSDWEGIETLTEK